MATSFKSEVDLSIKAPDAKNLEKTLTSILEAVDKLPGKGGEASKAVQEIVGQINKIKTALQNTGSLNSVINDVKALGASLKTINTLQKGLELFSNKDVQNINAATTQIQRAAKAYDEIQRSEKIQKGVFGLDEQKIAGVVKATRSLQQELKAVKQSLAIVNGEGRPTIRTNDPLFQRGLAIQRNLKALEEYRLQLQRNTDLEKYAADMVKQGELQKIQFIKAREEAAKRAALEQDRTLRDQLKAEAAQKKLRDSQQDGRTLAGNARERFARSDIGRSALQNQADFATRGTARFANEGYVALQEARRKLADINQENRLRLETIGLKGQDVRLSAEARAIQQQINAKVRENTIELAKGNGENEKTRRLSQEILDLQARLKIQRSQENQNNPRLKQAADQNRIDSMLSRTQGQGGGALLAVQASLIANYSVLTSTIGALQAAASNAVQLEAAFANIRAVTATTRTEMVGLEKDIRNIAAGSKFTAVEVADAALILGQAGLNAKAVADALPAVVNLATASGTTLANAVDLVTSIVGVFDKQATDTADIANKVTAASNNSKISVDKLALAFQYVGNAAAQTGVSFEETTAAIAAMSNAGIKSGSTLGTGLRQFLTELQKPSEEFLENLRRIGLGVSDIDVRAKGLTGVISTLREAGFVASDAIRSFDVRGAAAFNALVANPKALQEQYDLLQNTKAAVEANAIQMNTLDAQARRFTTTLNNAVAVGLDPLQKALTLALSAASNLLGPLTQFPGVLQAIVSGATIFVAVRLGAHLASVVGHALSLTGAFRAMVGPLAAATAATTAHATATAGLATATAGAGSAMVGASLVAARVGTMLTSLSGILTLVTAGFRGLGAAILALGPVGAIALAIGAVATASNLLGKESQATKDKIDSLKAAVDDAKGTFTATDTSVGLLTKKIEDLHYRQDSLEGSQKDLNQAARDLNSQFGNLGLQIDENNSSFTTMISKLKGVRDEMRQLADSRLNIQIQKQRELVDAEVNNVQSSLKDANRGFMGRTSVDALEAFMSRNKTLQSANLTPSQREAVPSGLNVLREAIGNPGRLTDEKTQAANLQALAGVSKTMSIIQESLKTPREKEQFAAISGPLRNIIDRAFDASTKAMELRGLQGTREDRQANQEFRAKPLFNGKTFEEAVPSFYDVQGRLKNANPNRTTPELFNETKAEIEKNLAIIDEAKRTMSDLRARGQVGEAVAGSAMAELTRKEEEFRAAGKKYYAAVENRYKQMTTLEIQEQNARAGNRNLSKAERQAAARKAGELAAQLEMAGVFGKDERQEAMAAQRLRVGEARADAVFDRGGGDADRALQDKYKAQAESLRNQAAVFEARAKGSKISASNASTLEEVDSLLDEAVNYLMQAKAKKVEALTAEQNARILPKNQDAETKAFMAAGIEAEKEKADEGIENFVQGATSIYKAVGRRTTKLGVKADADTKASELKQLQSAAEEKLYDATHPLAAIMLKRAQGDMPEDTTAEKQARIAITAQKIRNLGEELLFFNEYIETLQFAAAEAKARVEKLTGDLGNASPESKARIQAALEVALDDQRTTAERLRSTNASRTEVRDRLGNENISYAGQMYNMPLPANWENISQRMDQTVRRYQQAVDSFDEVGMIGNGIYGTLETATRGFQDLFTGIVSGSMSAKDAFKNFAASIVRSMLDIVAQAIAMQAVKSLLGTIFGAFGASTGVGAGVNASAGTAAIPPTFAAEGGQVVGGIPNRDSVPLMTMPGEFVVNKQAVDAVGVDFLHNLNSQSTGSVQSSARAMSNRSSEGSEIINIYVLAPDSKPNLGPRDILVVVDDALSRRSSTQTLVKTIAKGNV